jgi:two-component system, chemotaxis family, sensor kinase CheA
MNLAGELVLGRNQLLQAIVQNEARSINAAGQRINMVTSELQEAIMLTRMQAIGNIFNKFPRVVRDTARNVGKTIDLNIVGKEVEMDKTIIEGLNDPLTHLVRNAVDHGVETPDERVKAGKNPVGCVSMKAYHEAGQVNIEISDDGRGIDPQKIAASAVSKGQITAEQARTMSDQEKMALLFLPGVSTAEKVTEISGRGVGMDVVKTNIDRLGGQVEIESEPGQGSTFRIKLPLTLAIIPCLFVSVSGVRFAIPQANVEELIRITAAQVKERIERVGDADVLILRGNMIPIIHLANMLGIARTFVDPEMNVRKADKREIADRRSISTPVFEDRTETRGTAIPAGVERRKEERRYHADSDLNIVVVSIGTFSYGLVVEDLHDSIEIVVKPLGRHLKHLREYAGATIMGDGHVALILDVNGISSLAKLTSLAGSARAKELAEEAHRDKYQDIKSFLLFRNSPAEYCAVPLDLVERIEQVPVSSVEIVGGKRVMQYRGNSMPLFTIHEAAGNVSPLPEQESYVVIVFSISGRDLGLMGITPVDVTESKVAIDAATLRQKGIMGSAIINDHTTLIVDINELVETLKPEWFTQRKKAQPVIETGSVILLAEDSAFFRNQVKKYLEDEGYLVAAAEDGQAAWDLLAEYGEKVRLVVTDIEMPNLDGYGLSKKIKEDERFSHLPVIAVTSLAGEEDISRGKAAGIDDYQIKLDKDKLLASIYGYLKNTGRAA